MITRIEIIGEIVGETWGSGRCRKEVHREVHWDRQESLRKLVEELLHDGDFQSCELDPSTHIGVHRIRPRKGGYGRTTYTRYFPASFFKSLQDLLAPEKTPPWR